MRRMAEGTHPSYKSTNRRPVARNLDMGSGLIPRDEGRYFLFRKSSRIMSKRGSDQFKRPEIPMRFEDFSFGSIRIDGTTYEHDVVIDRGQIRKRKKKPSQKFRDEFGHTPLSIEEEIPWKCRRLVIGTGTGALPVMEEVKREAQQRKIDGYSAYARSD